MHELSLCQNLMTLIHQHAAGFKGRKVRTVFLEVGQLAGVDHAALLFAFKAVTMNSIAENARLEIIEIKGQARCTACNKLLAIEQYYQGCAECNEFALEIIAGEELRIQSIEVD